MCSFTAVHRQKRNVIKQGFLTLAKIARKSRPIVHFKIDVQVGSSTGKNNATIISLRLKKINARLPCK